MENEKDLEHFEEIVNKYLIAVKELEYTLTHFIKKSNKTTALTVRNSHRDVINAGKEFKTSSIDFFSGQ
jgi:hypothetical protein